MRRKAYLIGVLFLGACVTPKGPPQNTKTEVPLDVKKLVFGEPLDTQVTIEEILASCRNNQLRCEKDYGEKWVVVTGAFDRIEDSNRSLLGDARAQYSVSLSSAAGSRNHFLQCRLVKSLKADEFLRALNRGELLRAHGVLEVDVDVPVLRECWIERGQRAVNAEAP